jgi:hypothetical protein
MSALPRPRRLLLHVSTSSSTSTPPSCEHFFLHLDSCFMRALRPPPRLLPPSPLASSLPYHPIVCSCFLTVMLLTQARYARHMVARKRGQRHSVCQRQRGAAACLLRAPRVLPNPYTPTIFHLALDPVTLTYPIWGTPTLQADRFHLPPDRFLHPCSTVLACHVPLVDPAQLLLFQCNQLMWLVHIASSSRWALTKKPPYRPAPCLCAWRDTTRLRRPCVRLSCVRP